MKQKNFLIVEDDPTSALVISKILKEMGECTVLYSGETAAADVLEKAQGGKPYTAAFLDVMMPVKNGKEILHEIREMEQREKLPALPVFITTALSDADVYMKMAQLGCAGFLVKPISRRDLVEIMRQQGILA